MLTEMQCATIEQCLCSDLEPRKAAAYLCLHMGLMLSEVAALRVRDFDPAFAVADIRYTASKSGDGDAMRLEVADMPRTLPVPPHVRRYMRSCAGLYSGPDCFIMSGEMEPPPFYLMQNVLNSVNRRHAVGATLSAMDLRNAFIRRCIQEGMDLYSICAYIGIRQPNVILKRFSAYFRPNFDKLTELGRYSGAAEDDGARVYGGKRGMNLLILGAGSQGPVVREIAEALGIFTRIAFLDDDASNKLAIGPLSDYERLREIFPAAIPSFGNSALRGEYYNRLIAAGYAIPRLIHPTATISSSDVELGEGAVVEAKVIIANDVTVGENVILSAGCVLDRGCVIGKNCHVGCACTVTRGSVVPDGYRIPAGTVF